LEKAKRCLASDPAFANSLVAVGGRSRTLQLRRSSCGRRPYPAASSVARFVLDLMFSCCPIYSQASR
jgi:hypothetical protein